MTSYEQQQCLTAGSGWKSTGEAEVTSQDGEYSVDIVAWRGRWRGWWQRHVNDLDRQRAWPWPSHSRSRPSRWPWGRQNVFHDGGQRTSNELAGRIWNYKHAST